MLDAAYEAHKEFRMPAANPDKHSDNQEFHKGKRGEVVAAYDGKFYYTCESSYNGLQYLCISDQDGSHIKILAVAGDDYYWAYVHVNITGIYLYSTQDSDRLFITHYDFDGNKLSECREEYPGGYEDGYHVDNICFYDNKAYFVYSNKSDEVPKALIKCMDIDNDNVYSVYDKASSVSSLFALEDKLIFDAEYGNDEDDNPCADGWMILDLITGETECLSNPYCNPENVIYDPEVYDRESPRYNEKCDFDRNIVFFDFSRDIFWTERDALEGNDSKYQKHVKYREPKSLWGDRDSVVPGLPVWRVQPKIYGGYFDGTYLYYANSYYSFWSADMSGEIFEWSESGHGKCDDFNVIGGFLFLDIEAYGEEQYELTVEKSTPIRKSWFKNPLSQDVIDKFMSDKNETEQKSFVAQTSVDVLSADETDVEIDQNGQYDLYVEKKIGNTDIKYNICTFGAKFHIGFGRTVKITMNGKEYDCKTHNSAKGRIDGLKKLFAENEIKSGDVIRAEYYAGQNLIVLRKED